MDDLEKRYNNAKEIVRGYNILVNVNVGLVMIGLIFTIVNLIVKNDVTKTLNYVSLGIFGCALIMLVTLSIVFRKQLKEYAVLKKEMKSKK